MHGGCKRVVLLFKMFYLSTMYCQSRRKISPGFNISVLCDFIAYNVCVDVRAYVRRLAGMFYKLLGVTGMLREY